MALRFRRRGSEVEITLGGGEADLLTAMLGDLDALLAGLGALDDQGTGSEQDPIAAMVGIGTSTAPPSDPALARLFPDGYSEDDQSSADFRRYTQTGLRDSRRARVAVVLETLTPGRARLTTRQAEAWLGVLNDLRLVLGERLGVTEDLAEQIEALDEDDPSRPALTVYEWLGWVQESLVATLTP